MKKIMSMIISAMMILSLASGFPFSIITCSADEECVLTFGTVVNKNFEGITVQLDGDAIRFITDYPDIIVGTETEISLLRTDDGFLFKPKYDDKYYVSIMHDIPGQTPDYGSIWFPSMESFVYEIDINAGVISINGMHRLCGEAGENGATLVESYYPDGTSYVRDSDTGSFYGGYYLIACLADELDPLFVYYINDDMESSRIAYESLILSGNKDAEVWLIHDNKKTYDDGYDRMGMIGSDIGISSSTAKIFELGVVPFNYDNSKKYSVRIILNEGKRSKIYNLDYEEGQPVISTLKITECPEKDINADGKFNIADVVYLQRFLLGYRDDIEIFNWRAADLCEDGQLDVFDFVSMRKALTEQLPVRNRSKE